MTRLHSMAPVSALWALATLGGCATPATVDEALQAQAVVRYERSAQGLFIIPVTIDGAGPYRFIIDTGSTASGLFERSAPARERTPIADRTVLVHGMIATASRPAVAVETLGVGRTAQSVSQLVVFADPRDGLEADGILGMDFLVHYALVFDPQTRSIRFVPERVFSDRPYRRWRRARLHRGPTKEGALDLHFVDLGVGVDQIPTLVDTGSPATVLNWQAVEELQAFAPLRDRLRHGPRMQDVQAQARPTMAGDLGAVRVGDHVWDDQRVLVLEMEPLAMLGADEGPFAIAGVDLWAKQGFVLDFARDRLFLERDA